MLQNSSSSKFRFLFLFVFEIFYVLRKCLLGPFALIIDDCDASNKIFECFAPFLGYLKNFNFFDFLHVDCGGGVVYIFDSFFRFLMSTMHFFFIFDYTTPFPIFFRIFKFFQFLHVEGGCSLGTYCVYIEPVCTG